MQTQRDHSPECDIKIIDEKSVKSSLVSIDLSAIGDGIPLSKISVALLDDLTTSSNEKAATDDLTQLFSTEFLLIDSNRSGTFDQLIELLNAQAETEEELTAIVNRFQLSTSNTLNMQSAALLQLTLTLNE